MNRSGRLTFIKTSLVEMPTYTSISMALPAWLIKTFDKIMRVSGSLGWYETSPGDRRSWGA
jgi:hypothetical protein